MEKCGKATPSLVMHLLSISSRSTTGVVIKIQPANKPYKNIEGEREENRGNTREHPNK